MVNNVIYLMVQYTLHYLKIPLHLAVNTKINSDISLETADIFFIANLSLKQGISPEYVMIDFISMAFQTCEKLEPRITK